MANTSKNKNDRPATLPDGLALPQEQEIEKAILSGLWPPTGICPRWRRNCCRRCSRYRKWRWPSRRT